MTPMSFLRIKIGLKPGMHIGRRFRAAVEAIGIADPICAVHINAAPLMGILIFIHMFIRDAENVQTEPGSAGTACTGRGAEDKIAIRVIVMGVDMEYPIPLSNRFRMETVMP